MLFKRVHILKFKTSVTTGSTTNGNGDLVPGTITVTDHEVSCRAEPNGSGKTIKSNDGQDVVFSFKIFLDEFPSGLTDGTLVEIFKEDEKIGGGAVLMPFGYQKHAVIWV
ncbi:hypothetical protein [Parapedobacter indicus]|uniref:Uncharacterized protein n=1 Tax=Parapedobacter indicus TaxID=1477437 RepID=A0A1I3V3G0_9SPHI|nr:hypothetical protein [Parapedobacter indicus]PPK98977.1 hypothetical protein CLV26_1156 [Parapedobacter indicus]SFJ89775.1 hypothetical protein SAMN05444682_115171 [Parapedobacter indicus]